MDASCKIQVSIHVFRLVNNMCPGKWVHINIGASFKVGEQDPTLKTSRFEMAKQIKDLQADNASLRTDNEELRAEVNEIKAALKKLQ